MIRLNNINLNYIKRTLRPLYANSQATPQATMLDPNWVNSTLDIYPGMAMMRKGGNLVTVVDNVGDPYGLAAFFEAPVLGITEITNQGINAAPVWVLGPDAEFEVIAPAFDSSLTWTDPTDGTSTLVHAYASTAKRGQLCPAGTANATAKPVARLVSVVSASKIVIAGLQARTT